MIRQWLKRCCIGAMTAVLTVSSLPMSAFAEAGGVTYDAGAAFARVEGNTAIIGNGAIERKFDFANNKVKTTEIHNKRANTKMTPAEGSEEFIIKRTKKDNNAKPEPQPLDMAGATVQADSEEKVGEAAPHHGHAANMIDGNPGTFWHTAYEPESPNDPGHREMPHEFIVDLNKPTTFKSFSYDPRYVKGDMGSKVNGNIKGYELYVSKQENPPALEGNEGWTQVAKGEFDYTGNKGEAIHVNIAEDKLAECEGVQCVKLVATSSVNNNNFAGGEEFDLYGEKWVKPEEGKQTPMFLKTSDLELEGAPVIKDTTATINKQEKSGKQVSFKFKPVEFNGAEYTITENIVAYNGDHYMRKFLEISVPEQDKLDAEIDYIDLESLDVTASKDQWTIPTDQGSIVGAPKERAIIGQPFYADGMFFGCEFPAADTQIVTEQNKKIGRPRYYTGKTMDRLAVDKQATRAEDGSIHYMTWPTVAGSATATAYRVVQADFFDYINDIAAPSEFRIQYNSWYDDEKNISDKTILSSFAEMDREFSNTELRPLDSYVVDDGWTDYSANPGFWEFNNKFPNGFTPSSELVHNFGSNFGVWIGPRGGYGTNGTIAQKLDQQNLSVNAGGSIDVADRTYLEKYTELVNEFQDKYHVNYWKWDGFADEAQYNHYNRYGAGDGLPKHTNEVLNGKTKGHMIGGAHQMYHCSDMWEAWIDLYESVRANAEKNNIPNYWISSTTHTMPSPWLLQWVNSVWLQCQFDHARTAHGTTVHDGNLNARDAVYYSFVEKHQFQFPLDHIYNHDPVYGKSGTAMNATTATAEQFQNYLYSIAGRGTAFWELYYSDSILDEEKYEVNAEFLKWYEQNFHLLRHARMIGGWPVEGVTLDTGASHKDAGGHTQLNNDGDRVYNTYGYAGFEGGEGILTIRNAHAEKAQKLEFNFDDATLGVKGNKGDKFDYVIERHHNQPGKTSKVADKGTFTIGEKVSLELQPEESITIRVTKAGAGDKQGPSISTVMHNGDNKLTVRMDEKVKGDAAFTINGEKIAAENVKRSADGITYHITLAKAPAKNSKLDVKVSGITDMAGNALKGESASITFHNGNVVASRCPSRLTTYTKKLASAEESLVSKTGFSVMSKVKTAGHGPLVKQQGAFELGIDEAGKAYFDVNGVRATSKATVNDGKSHTVFGVRENNGILKVYVDGKVDSAKYEEKSFHHVLPAGDILFAGGTFNKETDEASAKVYDKALGYNEIEKIHEKLNPNTEEHNLAAGKKATAKWTKDGSDAVKANEGSMANITDGNKASSAFGVFGADGKTDSSYMEIDLGDVREVSSVNLWRYFQDGRTYRDTVVALSEDAEFTADDQILFNSDKQNHHKLGAGSNEAYAETAEGKSFKAKEGTRARYVRVYMRGQADDKTTNHVVELEVMGRDIPVDAGAAIDTSALYARIDEVRDYIAAGKYTDGSIQKVMDKLEAAELVADCPKSKKDVDEALESLKGIEDLLKQGVTVSFQYVDAPEGVAAPAAVEIEEGQALGDKLPVPAAVEGYTFAGWFTDEACTKGHEFDGKTKVTANMTVFGKWVKGEAPVPPAPNPDPEDPKPGETPLTPLEPATPVKPEEKPADRPGKKPSGDKLVQTGDNAMIGIAAAGIAGVALIGAAVVTRKRNRA